MRITVQILMLSLLSLGLCAQTHSNEETLRIDLSGIEEIGLYNHRGDIKVIGSNTDQAVLKYTRKLKSASRKKLDEAKSEIKLVSEKDNGKLRIFHEAPDLKFKVDADGRGHYRSPNWNDWNDRYQVSFEFDIVLEIPTAMNLEVSNHHSGLEVKGVTGEIVAHNHHKDLSVENAGAHVQAESHHGDVTVSHTVNPNQDSNYETHHGDIRVSYQAGLNVEAKLHTHHGSFYTDFDWDYRPLQVSQTATGKGTKYKIGEDTVVRIGKGGPTLDFHTHHGSIYLLRD